MSELNTVPKCKYHLIFYYLERYFFFHLSFLLRQYFFRILENAWNLCFFFFIFRKQIMENDGLNVTIFENMLMNPDEVFTKLQEEIQYLPYEEACVCIRGIKYPVPRQITAYGDSNLSYTFSGLTLTCKPWTPLLLDLKTAVESLTACSYNFVLINRYRNGSDCIGQHKDKESSLDAEYPISLLSLGETRVMKFCRPGFADHDVELKDNTLIVMHAPTNALWTHGIPRQEDKKGTNVTLTFRCLKETPKKKSDEERKPEVSTFF